MTTAHDSATLQTAYHQQARRRGTILVVLGVTLLVSLLLDIVTGPALLPVAEVIRAITGESASPSTQVIVWTIRLPVALTALAVGAALGLSGAVMQTILHNPLASSYTLGISAGAGFGASLVIVLGWSLPIPETYAVAFNAMLFAGLSCAGVYGIAGTRGATAEALVLAGIALLFLFQALTALLQMIASPEALQQVVFWLFGSLQKTSWTKLAVLTAALISCLPPLARDVWALTAMKLGDARAAALGVKVRSLRLRSFALISG
ncbi:MAG: iron ABC transporter permease, partial [Rhodoferax sp.]|nr:iron ABC transporter permease [Rhodoferax sp.]